jgi:hypothetical protein
VRWAGWEHLFQPEAADAAVESASPAGLPVADYPAYLPISRCWRWAFRWCWCLRSVDAWEWQGDVKTLRLSVLPAVAWCQGLAESGRWLDQRSGVLVQLPAG